MSKAELRAMLAAHNVAAGQFQRMEMASVDDLKTVQGQNVPSLNFRGKPAYIRVSAKTRCER